MVESIKLFQYLEGIFRSMTVLPSGQNRALSILKRIVFFTSMIVYIVEPFAFFVNEAKTVVEYGDSFYLFTTESTTTFYYYSYFQQIHAITPFIDKLNEFFYGSKLINYHLSSTRWRHIQKLVAFDQKIKNNKQ